MRIALFSDIHGKILLPFKLTDLYQKEKGVKIDLILQCGDIGAYPNLENLDKATIKHAKYDRDELGFHDDFTTVNLDIKKYLDELNINMFCVRGNHEDHDYLNELEKKETKSAFPIDIYNRVWLCKTGKIQELTINNKTISFVGIGRIGDRKGRTEQRFIQNYEQEEIKKLQRTNRHFDILITHDKDDSSQRGYGMSEIRNLLDNTIFHYHFYGHTGEPFNIETDVNGITNSCKIKELEFNENGVLPYGCMIILNKLEDDKFEIEIVKQNITNKLAKHNWKY